MNHTGITAAIASLAAVLAIAAVLSGTDMIEEEEARQANYCELRRVYEQTGGEYGWPEMAGYEVCSG